MKKKLLSVFLLLALSAGILSIGIAAEDDPLLSLSYLEEIYKPQLLAEYALVANSTLHSVYGNQLLQLCDTLGQAKLDAQQGDTGLRNTSGSFRVKSGDLLTLRPGTALVLLSGSAITDTLLSDVTAGAAVTGTLPLNHSHMASQDTGITITSPTAVVQITGSYTLEVSDAVDFNALADGLHTMGLFQGGSTGYELERYPSRVEGLVMFLRLLGLEDEALASTVSHPFSDVPAWADRYVAYAYAEGLTQGTGQNQFSPDARLTSQQYITFLLRALHYEESADFSYDTAMTDSVRLGLFSQQESAMVTANFTRAHMVYLSFYSLFGVDQDAGELLLVRLEKAGTVTEASIAGGLSCIVGKRLV